MTSDHYPIKINLNSPKYYKNLRDLNKIDYNNIKHLDYKKANWDLFKTNLNEDLSNIEEFDNLEEVNDKISKTILKAAHSSIPEKNDLGGECDTRLLLP